MARRYVPVAEVARPHGIQGELRLKLYNQDSDLLLQRPEVKLELADGTAREVSIHTARDVNKALLVKFTGVTTRDAAEALRGARILVPRDIFPQLGEGEFYACDLEGARARLPSGEEVGRVTGIQSYPTCDVLLIERAAVEPSAEGPPPRSSSRLEVPLVEAYVASVDVEGGVVELVTLDGLA